MSELFPSWLHSRSQLDTAMVWRYLLRVTLVAAAYYVSAKAGFAFAVGIKQVTAAWPPTGLALAAMLIWGRGIWSGIAVGALLANLTASEPVGVALAITVGNTLEAVCAVTLLKMVPGFNRRLERQSDVIWLVVCGGVLSTLLSATVGVYSLVGGGLLHHFSWGVWKTWWFGDMGGDVIVAPLCLVGVALFQDRGVSWNAQTLRRAAEAAGLLALVAGLSLVVFGIERAAFPYMLFPVALVIAMRLQLRGAALANLLIAAIAVWFTAHGHGPFGHEARGAGLLQAQTFAGVIALTSLLAGALNGERQRAGVAEAELRRDRARIHDLADRDPLTNLLNRRAFERIANRALSSLGEERRGALLALDLDRFKAVNDTHGHAVGDGVLVEISRRISHVVRASDTLARIGGDEFALLLADADEADALAVAHDIVRAVGSTPALNDGGHPIMSVGVSVGVALLDGSRSLPETLASADAAMYRAKRERRSPVEFVVAAEPAKG